MKAIILAGVLGIIIGAALVAALMVNSRPDDSHNSAAAPPVTSPGAIAVAPPLKAPDTTVSPPVLSGAPVEPVVAPPQPDDPTHGEFVRAETERLMSLAMNDDAASLNAIWAQAYSQDKEIRAAAIDAVVQFGDRSMIPRMRALAEQTKDPTEKAHITESADFLALPKMGEKNQPPPKPASP